MKNMYVYILLCNDNTYYVGVTNDLDGRLWQHQNPESTKSYTAKRQPLRLVYFADFYGNPDNAIAFEKQVKSWSKAKKEALIRGDFKNLKELSVCRNSSHHRNMDKSPLFSSPLELTDVLRTERLQCS